MARIVGSPLPAILALVAVAGGALALLVTPREEEPQIVVPVADVVVSAPGLSAAQVERQVATPLEKLLFQIDGVEYVYSMSQPGRAVVTVRFHVGEDREDSLVKIYNKVNSNTDQVPAAVDSWVVKPVEIDDVPIVLAVLWSEDPVRIGDHELRRLAEEVARKLQSVENTNRVEVTGGRPRRVRVELDVQALAARRTAPLDVAWAIGVSNEQLAAGRMQRRDRSVAIESGSFLTNARELRHLVVNVVDGVPVYLKDVASIIDGPAEPASYTWIGFGPADATLPSAERTVHPAAVVSVAKKKGTNAVWVARHVEKMLAALERELFPEGVHYRIIRNYGETANEKVNDLVSSLLVAVLTVVVFIAVFIGWRAAVIVGLAVPVCYGVTLLLDLLTGYTINRVTLFALILALGLLVDDPITGVDNIERYFRLGRFKALRSVVSAMSEIRGALIMSTVAIIVAFAPMFFITGMMGPYMAPMAFNVPVAVTVSTAVAFLVTPWLAYRVLPHQPPAHAYDVERTLVYRVYAGIVSPLIQSRRRAWAFVVTVLVLFVVATALPAFRLVPLKLLPYDNKDEFQIIIDMPEGTTLERTAGVARALAEYLRSVPEVRDFTAFVGIPSPMDFNGMIRHYYLRDEPHQADIRVTLAGKRRRSHQSHEILLRIRRDLQAVAQRHDAPVKLVEVPPGPPVIATVTAELYGALATPYARLQHAAKVLAERLVREPLVVDVDTSVEADRGKLVFVTDKEKAALSGIATEDIARTVVLAVDGATAGFLQIPTEADPLPIELRLPVERRSSAADLAGLYVKGRAGIAKVRERGGVRDAPRPLVQLGEVGRFQRSVEDQSIYHKNLARVAYVYAEVAGRTPAEVIADVSADRREPGAVDHGDSRTPAPRALDARTYLDAGGGMPWSLPDAVSVAWTGEGEWFITLRVFRDLGIAFAVAVVGIFLVLYVQTGLAAVAGIILLAIPLSVIGIMPGFWFLNQIGERVIEAHPNPILFTATAMIGMIALAGIVVRNSLILVEFIQLSLGERMDLRKALMHAGAVRMRPVLLTAGTTLLGNLVITLDPIFSGLAWAIIFGLLASTLFTLVVVPVVYFLVYDKKPGHGLPQRTALQ
ncbi:MAG: efflux RND transporter permease subunit [Gammaproteobacteria bacterium]|nr:efflux RND transporter permease subunit [Gammaproteobacteria bacterium]NIR83499.1 efflux RND transporter permease subunit [Gammaproteobacteria bacterium]NIR91421.1 efflux RND transporter permease subunit [Gammaproteobacteria bacterium]NIU04661.1 efflux RND transporter permease subunit [Gammaproteobacteria bacterium]NIV51703.1 AcrB/AcrD/AcrF family protein [Gammaproteobacteria bacterium]